MRGSSPPTPPPNPPPETYICCNFCTNLQVCSGPRLHVCGSSGSRLHVCEQEMATEFTAGLQCKGGLQPRSPEALQEMQLSLEASFKSGRPLAAQIGSASSATAAFLEGSLSSELQASLQGKAFKSCSTSTCCKDLSLQCCALTSRAPHAACTSRAAHMTRFRSKLHLQDCLQHKLHNMCRCMCPVSE